jgi:methyl-accepting chemotaxis protein
MTKQSADNAQQANQLAAGARTAATEGASSMEQMQAAMGKIKASAEGTSQIIRDINDIAFQTNLLALNAAVEAARAGEAGRGFAVVAEEVRSLALRAKEAATKTEELIRQSVKEANEGEVTAKHVAGKLGEIVEGVGKVTDIVSEIAAAAKEQATGIEQVNKAIGEMDKVTQQNAASAEESSSAASELSGQAEELAAMVGAFRLSRQGGQAKVTARPAAKAAALPAPPRNGKHARADKAFPMDGDDIGAEF